MERIVNYNNRANNGFFLTSSKDASAEEKAMLADAVAVASKGLYTNKIRGSNVLEKMKELDALALEVENSINAHTYDVGNTTCYAYMIIFACMSSYNTKMMRLAAKRKSE